MLLIHGQHLPNTFRKTCECYIKTPRARHGLHHRNRMHLVRHLSTMVRATPPPIAILGAGPSGLALGRMLQNTNIDYTIFERDESPSSSGQHGGTLDLHVGSGQLALERAGLMDKFKSLARYDASNVLAGMDGSIVASLGAEGPDSERPEIDRKDLRSLLLGSLPSHKVRWGKRTQHVQKDSDGSMAVHFSDGSVESGFRLVVGADGAWSKARSLVSRAAATISTFNEIPNRAYHTGHIRQTSVLRPVLPVNVGQTGREVPRGRRLAGRAGQLHCLRR